MSAADLFKINLNQNIWGLLVCFGFLGAAEYFRLCTLFWFAAVGSGVMLASAAATMLAYTINYWQAKMSKADQNLDKR